MPVKLFTFVYIFYFFYSMINTQYCMKQSRFKWSVLLSPQLASNFGRNRTIFRAALPLTGATARDLSLIGSLKHNNLGLFHSPCECAILLAQMFCRFRGDWLSPQSIYIRNNVGISCIQGRPHNLRVI